MPTALYQFAETATTAQGGILGTLGIDVKLLIFQTIAFLLLLWLLTKFVFPALGAMLERREKLIEDSIKAAQEAEKNAAATSEKTAELLKQARKDADEIVSSAKAESAGMVEAAEKKSRERSEQIVADAQVEIRNDVEKARKALKKEALNLVAVATEKVVGASMNDSLDKKTIESAVNEAERP